MDISQQYCNFLSVQLLLNISSHFQSANVELWLTYHLLEEYNVYCIILFDLLNYNWFCWLDVMWCDIMMKLINPTHNYNIPTLDILCSEGPPQDTLNSLPLSRQFYRGWFLQSKGSCDIHLVVSQQINNKLAWNMTDTYSWSCHKFFLDPKSSTCKANIRAVCWVLASLGRLPVWLGLHTGN